MSSETHMVKEHTLEIALLNTTRRVRVFLPEHYSSNSDSYPVVYLQDGQNLIDGESPFGSWKLDHGIHSIEEQGIHAIYVAIDHAKERRIIEYSPTMPWSTKAESKGFEYLQWLSKELKPFIDANYRTNPHRDATVIGGSSMGALISLYASSIYPEVFSRFLIFSPSLWLRPSFGTNPNLYLKLSQARFYLYAGEKESKSLLPNVLSFHKMVKEHSINDIDITLSINRQGTHSEPWWAAEFPKAILWLLKPFKK